MNEISIIEYGNEDLTNSMLIVAFPTVGLVSSIAGQYIIDTLKLKPIGTIISDRFTPATVIHKSIPSPPVRIYTGEKTCGPKDSCKKLTIIISEFMPTSDMIKPLVDKILEWAKIKGCEMILSFEGLNSLTNTVKKKPKVYGVGSTAEMKAVLQSQKIEQTQEGMITGVTGVLLYQGVLQNINILCLLAETRMNFPDSRAAASLLEVLDVMLPSIKIDAQPLYKAAKQIEDNIVNSMKQSKPTGPAVPPLPYSMYG